MVENAFELVNLFEVEYAPTEIKRWRSTRTGLQIVSIKQETPMVYGHFAVATEVPDDSGTPHTLEHLIFLGSKKFPYKGLLDTLGNMHFSNTNAWTATDKTVYTLETAGWEGFNKLLPVYLDHLLYPTLTDEACYTEVYHVDGSGKDKGVVYSEMESHVLTNLFLSELECGRTLFAKDSGYSSETGGLLESLRVLTNEKIREFHKSMYRPDNLCVIVAGSVHEDELMETMINFDNDLPDLPKERIPRPFIDSPDPFIMKEKTVKEIEFPDLDESSGAIYIGFIGPEYTDSINYLAYTILFSYLSDDSSSPLQSSIVEIDDPLASDLCFYANDYLRSYISVFLAGVPTERLHECEKKFQKTIFEHYEKKSFDLVRMRIAIEFAKDELVSDCEKAFDKFTDGAINDFVYGNDETFDEMKTLKCFDILKSWDLDKWLLFYKKYLIDEPYAAVLAKPSAALFKSKNSDEKALVKDRIAKLGEEGLEKLEKKLEKANEINNKPIPDEVLYQYEKSDISSIDFIKTNPIKINDPSFGEDTEFKDKIFKSLTDESFPLNMYFDNYKSDFITIKLMLSSFAIPKEYIPYFLIFEDLFSLPMTLDDGTEMTYEQVVDGLKKDLISYSFHSGIASFNEILQFSVICKKSHYNKAIEWIQRLLFNTKFDRKRIKVEIDKFIGTLPEYKRDGNIMLTYLSNHYLTDDRSISKSYNILDVEETFYKFSLMIDTEEGYNKIVSDLEEIRTNLLYCLENYRVVVYGGISDIDEPVNSWKPIIDKIQSSDRGKNVPVITEIPRNEMVLTDQARKFGKKAYLMATPGSESSYLYSICNFEIGYLHEDFAAVMLIQNYLEIPEGPFWKFIRGNGLAYHASISLYLENHEIFLNLLNATDVVGSLNAAKAAVDELLSEDGSGFDNSLVDGAISMIVSSFASKENNFQNSARNKYIDTELRLRGADFKQVLFAKLKSLTTADLVAATKKYFVPMFELDSSCLFITYNPKNEKIVEDIRILGYEIVNKTLSTSDEEVTSDEDECDDDDNDDDDYVDF